MSKKMKLFKQRWFIGLIIGLIIGIVTVIPPIIFLSLILFPPMLFFYFLLAEFIGIFVLPIYVIVWALFGALIGYLTKHLKILIPLLIIIGLYNAFVWIQPLDNYTYNGKSPTPSYIKPMCEFQSSGLRSCGFKEYSILGDCHSNPDVNNLPSELAFDCGSSYECEGVYELPVVPQECITTRDELITEGCLIPEHTLCCPNGYDFGLFYGGYYRIGNDVYTMDGKCGTVGDINYYGRCDCHDVNLL